MNVPAAVESALDGESVAVRVPLKGEDALFVTPTRTLVYRAEGLLSDESVAAYPHDAERVDVSEGRRKSTISLDYGLEGVEEFTVPTSKLDDVLHPVLAGVLNASGVTQPGETVKRTYRFSELTLVVTSDRLVKHVGGAVWDEDYEEIPFETVRDVGVEEGNVASQLVLTTDRRTERIKAPNDQFRAVRESVEDALFAHHDVRTYEEFRRVVGADEEPEEERASATDFQESALESIELSVGEEEAQADSGVEAEPEPERRRESASGREQGAESGGTAGPEAGSTAESAEPATQPTGRGANTSSVGPTEPDAEAAGAAVEPEPEEEPPLDREMVEAELEALHDTVRQQQQLLERQREQIEALLDVTRDR